MKGDNRRQWETTGDKTTSEPKKPTTPTNTHPLHEGRQPETMGDNGRQDHFRAQEADQGRQPETMGDNGRQDHFRAQEADHFRAQEADHTNQHPPLT